MPITLITRILRIEFIGEISSISAIRPETPVATFNRPDGREIKQIIILKLIFF